MSGIASQREHSRKTKDTNYSPRKQLNDPSGHSSFWFRSQISYALATDVDFPCYPCLRQPVLRKQPRWSPSPCLIAENPYRGSTIPLRVPMAGRNPHVELLLRELINGSLRLGRILHVSAIGLAVPVSNQCASSI